MSDTQEPIIANGKEYFAQPQTNDCCGCAGDGRINEVLCHALPYCGGVIFVERKPGEYRDLNGKPVAPTYDQGYADGLAAKQSEWDNWKAAATSVLNPSGAAGIYGVARTYDPATSHKAAQGMGRKAGRIADLILVELRDANLTGSMLAERTGVALNSITPRFAQLFRKGLIHAAGGSGRETVWAIGNGISAT